METPKVTVTGNPKPNEDSALYYLHKSDPIARRIGKPSDLLTLDVMLGAELIRRKDQRATTYFQEALARCFGRGLPAADCGGE